MTIRQLRKSYRGRVVLDSIDLDVPVGSVFGLLGRNGAGKTTTMEVLLGLRPADSGRVEVLGLHPVHDRTALRALVGAQLQSAALPGRMRVGEAVRLFTRLAGDVVDWRTLMDDWDLARLHRSSFESLSGGERQRLFVALSLANRPQVVFLDELTQGLDAVAREQTWGVVRRVADSGTTVVLVTHDMVEAQAVCDAVAILHSGLIAASGTPAEVAARFGGPTRCRFSYPITSGAGQTSMAGFRFQLEGLPGVDLVTFAAPAGPQLPWVVEVCGEPEVPVRVAALIEASGVCPSDFTVQHPGLTGVLRTLESDS